jgi:ribonuclease VapC
MFVDASAMCAILLEEPEARAIELKLAEAQARFTSPVAVFETVLAVMRHKAVQPDKARAAVARFIDTTRIEQLVIGDAEREAALDAMARFGKGRHPARLNMGDCFAYACAKVHGVPLLFKGDDFAQTDIAQA